MMIDNLYFHHIGVAVESIEKTSLEYKLFGYKISAVTYDPIQNVNICWMSKGKMPLIELVEPVNEDSPINRILQQGGVSPYHICYIVDNIEEAVSELRTMKYVMVSRISKAIAIQNSQVCFLFNKNMGLIELVELSANITEG